MEASEAHNLAEFTFDENLLELIFIVSKLLNPLKSSGNSNNSFPLKLSVLIQRKKGESE